MPENMNNNEYIRKDVFDARMDRMEILLEKTVIEIKSYVDNAISEIKAENAKFHDEVRAENAKLRDEIRIEIAGIKTEIGELRTEIGEVRNDVRLLSARVDSLENVFYWGLGGFGIILASAVIVPAILGFLKKLFQPSVTIEDVERIVNAAISQHMRGGKAE